MRPWLAYLILFLLNSTVQSHENRSPNKRIPRGKPTTPYPTTTEDTSCGCITLFDPVCGTDGLTYGNSCELGCARKENSDLKEAHHGACVGKCPHVPKGKKGCVCTEEFNPVCGSDGKTYGNFCFFCCAQRENKDLEVAHAGECNDQCPAVPEGSPDCPCTDEVDPVCGSDMRTYFNFCMFCCAQRDNPGLEKVHDGECKCPAVPEGSTDCACTKEFNPVCGSDGVTYGNFCTFCCAQRQNPDLTKAHDGACDRA